MQALTSEAVFQDEPAPIFPVLVDVETPAEPATLTERLALFGGCVYWFLEDSGGGIWDETRLGPLSEDLYDFVAKSLWPMLDRWLSDGGDAREFGAACRAEQERRY